MRAIKGGRGDRILCMSCNVSHDHVNASPSSSDLFIYANLLSIRASEGKASI